MHRTIKTHPDTGPGRDSTQEIPSGPSIRPDTLDSYIGQDAIRDLLRIHIAAAKGRGEPLDHVLLTGPPGLGKTTLSAIIAKEMGTGFRVTSGPAIEKPGELASILATLKDGDVLFIDEIHRLDRSVEEVLYPAMEDHAIDIVIGKDAQAKSIRVGLPHFTLVGATTRPGMLSAPLRDRFGILLHLDYYSAEDLKRIVLRTAGVLGTDITPDGAEEIAVRARGTPRLANRLLKRVRDFADVRGDGRITAETAKEALDQMDVDPLGLDNLDRKILRQIAGPFSGGPVGLDTLAASIGEDPDTIRDVYEPYLLKIGFLARTPRGRMLTKLAQDSY